MPSPKTVFVATALAGVTFAVAARAEPKLNVTLGSVQRNVAKLTPYGDGSEYPAHAGVCLYRAGKATACGYVVTAEPSEVHVRLTHGSNRFVAGESLRLVPIPRFSKPVTFGPDITPPPAAAPRTTAMETVEPARTPAPTPSAPLPPMAASAPRTTAGERIQGLPPSQVERSFSKPNAMLLASGAAQYGNQVFFGAAPGFLFKVGTNGMLGPKGFLSFYPDFTALGAMLTFEYYVTEAPKGFFATISAGAVQLSGSSTGVSESVLGILAQGQFGYVLRITEVIGFRFGVGLLYLGKTRTPSIDLNLNALNAQGEGGLLLFF